MAGGISEDDLVISVNVIILRRRDLSRVSENRPGPAAERVGIDNESDQVS